MGSKQKNVLVLFDVDGTLTPARKNIEQLMFDYLQELKTRVVVGLVGGSDLSKIAEQMAPPNCKSNDNSLIDLCVQNFDYVFAENGLVAYRSGSLLAKQSIVSHLGENRLQRLINYCLGYMSLIELPLKRGNFIEFRNGLINICPVGRSCTQAEREMFMDVDEELQIRTRFVEDLYKQFGPQSQEPLGLDFVIGGQISIDAYPLGWDKTFCLNFVDKSFEQIHFFGDKTAPGGNDHAIFDDSRTIGHTVRDPTDTLAQLQNLNL